MGVGGLSFTSFGLILLVVLNKEKSLQPPVASGGDFCFQPSPGQAPLGELIAVGFSQRNKIK